MDALVDNADGVVGRNLLGDAVDGSAISVESPYIDTVEGVARIEFLHIFDVGTVPVSGRHSVFTYRREARLQDVVVDEGMVGIGTGVFQIVLFVFEV